MHNTFKDPNSEITIYDHKNIQIHICQIILSILHLGTQNMTRYKVKNMYLKNKLIKRAANFSMNTLKCNNHKILIIPLKNK